MQLPLQNSDTRTLPEGWADHFDSERQIWYYIDLHSEKPRVSFAHPCDLDRQHPSSAPARVKEHLNPTRSLQRPVGPRKNSSASVNSVIRETQRARRATVAQQLYASGLTLAAGGSTGLRTPSATFRCPSVSNSPASDEVASNSAKGSTVSSTSPPPLSPHLDTHHPRNFFDCTRLAPGTRRMTVNGARPSLTPTPMQLASDPGAQSDGASYAAAQAFYHPSVSVAVNLSPSPMPISAKDPSNAQIAQLNKASSQRPRITTPYNNAFSSSTSSLRSNRIADKNSYNSTTEDDLLIMPNYAASHTLFTPLNVSTLQNAQPETSGSSKKPRGLPPLATTTILQPKPIRPMHGISLNLQVQVAGVAEAPTHGETSKSKRKSQLLNFGLGGSKGVWKGKERLVEPPEEGSGAPSGIGMLASNNNMDDSFVLVDILDQN
ncbi:hypothetical protein CVT25_005961 [Psilocybe cyanescens]|uniref:WW domain-containing protein n=1 Tax=Psilocybe cyanescens TaxID=93625 RepID=A0A409VM88_PSICY|nr:hypothetical protein CVT25_005961 [Psilocybe cyanescens]